MDRNFFLRFTRIIQDHVIISSIIALLMLLYLSSMYFYPLYVSSGSFKYLISTLYSWQTFNSALIAFLASLILLVASTAQLNYQKQKDKIKTELEYSAEKAFLVDSLSEFSGYLKIVAKILSDSLRYSNLQNESLKLHLSDPPKMSSNHRAIFKDLMVNTQTPDEVKEWLTNILLKYQIQQSRFQDYCEKTLMLKSNSPTFRSDIISQAKDVIELKAIVSRGYEYARGETGFDHSPITYKELISASRALAMYVEQFTCNSSDYRGFDLQYRLMRLSKTNFINMEYIVDKDKIGHYHGIPYSLDRYNSIPNSQSS